MGEKRGRVMGGIRGGLRVRKRREGYGWGKWERCKGGKKGRVMDGEKKGELWVGKGGGLRMGKKGRVMGEEGESYGWEKWRVKGGKRG